MLKDVRWQRWCCWLALCWALAPWAAAQSFVLGPGPGENASIALRNQVYGSAATKLVFQCSQCLITDFWCDEVSHQTFFATRSLDGSAGAVSMGYAFRWIYGGTIAGAIYGLTGSRALNSPSVYYVWSPSTPSSPPFTMQPALYRVPFYGGIPEVVTLHAQLCAQISIVELTLYCLSTNGTFYRFRLDRPNSAFEALPFRVPAAAGYVASQQHVIFAWSAVDGRLYRSDSPATSVALPAAFTSPWAPTLYNPPTDTIAFSLDGGMYRMSGMEAFWDAAVHGLLGRVNGTLMGPTSLTVLAFSAALSRLATLAPLLTLSLALAAC